MKMKVWRIPLGVLGILGSVHLPEDVSLDQWDAISGYVKMVIGFRQHPIKPSLRLTYDDEVDVLYLSLRTPLVSDSTEERDGLVIDRDAATGEVVGVTVLDYERKFRSLSDLSWVMDLRLPSPLAHFLVEHEPAILR